MSRKPRIKNPAMVLGGAVPALQALAKIASDGVPPKVLELAQLRASQINGCGVCCDLHTKLMRADGETDERMHAVAAWRDTPYFTDAERAALDLAEHVTRIADLPDPVPDAVWDEAARHYDERALCALLLGIGVINTFNRLNVASQQMAQPNLWKELRKHG